MKSVTEQFFGCKSNFIGEVVILSCFERLADFEKLYPRNLCFRFEGYYKGISFKFGKMIVSVIVTRSGAALVGDAVLALRGTPCRIVIYTGTAGGLSEKTEIGDIIVAAESEIGEGFSPYYIKDNTVVGSLKLINSFNSYYKVQNRIKANVHIGKIFTIESIFAETDLFLRKLESRNCLAIDMETSAFYTASRISGFKAIAIHYISDLPMHDKDYDMFKKKCIRSFVMMPGIIMEFILADT